MGLAAGNAEAQTKPKPTKRRPGTSKKAPPPPPAPVVAPPADDFGTDEPMTGGDAPSSTPAANTGSVPPPSDYRAREPIPDSVLADPAPVPPPPAPVAAPKQTAVKPAQQDRVPPSAPFTDPASSRALPPPSGLAGLDLPDPAGDASSIEDSVNALLSEAVVTTASKRRQRIKDVPMTVAWIPAEELEGTGAFTLCEAIQYFPGLECRRGSMRKAAVSARGLGSNYLSNRLLLLKDGRPLTDPWTGQFYADETTPLSNLKQVEVIRGPGSSLYGSNAFSGVINLIERQPSDLIKEGRNVGFDGRVLAGQDSTFRVNATAAGRGGPVEALASYYGFGSDGPQLFNNPQTGLVDTNQDSQVHQISGKVKVGAFALDADFTDAEIGRPGGTQISTVGNCGRCHYTPSDTENVQNLNAAAQVDKQVSENLRVFGQAYTLYKRRVVDQMNMITGKLEPALGKRRRYGAEARALLTAGNFNVTFGGDVKDDLVNNQNVLAGLTMDDTTQSILGGFVDAEYRPMSRLVLGAGVRYDAYLIPEQVWTERTNQLSPRASVVFHALPELTLRTNYGRAFRAPTLAELAINQQMYAATLLGNSALRAETLDTYEAAVDYWAFDRRMRLTATGFYNRAKNFINQNLVFGSTSQFQNIGDAQVVGIEAEVAAQLPAANSSFDVAYQYLDARSQPYGDGPSAQLDYAPRHRVYARARTNIGKVGFAEVYALYVGQRFDPGFLVESTGEVSRVKLPDYVTASARVGVNINEGVSVSLLGTNLFDSQYEESHGFPAPPRGVYSELKLRY
ncbi:TonB-dependent receptor plug domain-containing protein [Stigmatella hybrida]|uniref:TonB-dependent receptor plug domain-containing protein n=1 Tax=Stigmatella hybrida TaxID=394097 RepID=UPI001CDABC9F|nr:TonB-dependent receptor [Stigmatella hybrida]